MNSIGNIAKKKTNFKNPFSGNTDETTDGNSNKAATDPVTGDCDVISDCNKDEKTSVVASIMETRENLTTKEKPDKVLKKKKKSVQSFQAPEKVKLDPLSTKTNEVDQLKMISDSKEKENESGPTSAVTHSSDSLQIKEKKKKSGFHNPAVSAEHQKENKEIKKKKKSCKSDGDDLTKEQKKPKKEQKKPKKKKKNADERNENSQIAGPLTTLEGNANNTVGSTTPCCPKEEKADYSQQEIDISFTNPDQKLVTSFPVSKKNLSKENGGKKEKPKKEKKEKLLAPVLTPLTDKDYEEIFNAVIEGRCSNIEEIDECSQKSSLIPITASKNCNESVESIVVCKNTNLKRNTTEKLQPSPVNSNFCDVEKENDDAVIDHTIDTNVMDVEENQVPEDLERCDSDVIQQINEITPEGSEIDCEKSAVQHLQETPPHKKKQKKNLKSASANRLEPRQLYFPKSDAKSFKNKKDKKSKPDIKIKGQKKSPKLDRKQNFLNRGFSSCGTWVQCCDCQKWRLLLDIDDPTEIPDKWICQMNRDEKYDACEKIEQSYNEDDHIFTKYSEGSVVWARIPGYPWWPAMIEIDPDTESFYEVTSANSQTPTYYHVVFFDEKVTRAWIKSPSIMQFSGKEHLDMNLKVGKSFSLKKEIAAAKVNAIKALELSVKDRLKTYSFGKRYKGKWGRSMEDIVDEEIPQKPKKKLKVRVTRKGKNGNKENVNEMIDYLDNTTVDKILDDPDKILKGFEEVLESIDSDTVSDDENDPDFLPKDKDQLSDTQCDVDVVDAEVETQSQSKLKKDTCQVKVSSKKRDTENAKSHNTGPTKRKKAANEHDYKEDLKTLKKKKSGKTKSEVKKQNSIDVKQKEETEDLNMISEKAEMYIEVKVEDTNMQDGEMIGLEQIKELDVDDIEKMVEKESNNREFDSDIFTMEMTPVEAISSKPEEICVQNKSIKLDSDNKVSSVSYMENNIKSEHGKNELENQNINFLLHEDRSFSIPDEQTVPSLEQQAEEETRQGFDNELCLDIPVVAISKHTTNDEVISNNVAVLVTDNDAEDSDPFDMEE